MGIACWNHVSGCLYCKIAYKEVCYNASVLLIHCGELFLALQADTRTRSQSLKGKKSPHVSLLSFHLVTRCQLFWSFAKWAHHSKFLANLIMLGKTYEIIFCSYPWNRCQQREEGCWYQQLLIQASTFWAWLSWAGIAMFSSPILVLAVFAMSHFSCSLCHFHITTDAQYRGQECCSRW